MLQVGVLLILAAPPAVLKQGIAFNGSYPLGPITSLSGPFASGSQEYLLAAEGASVTVNVWNATLQRYEVVSTLPINSAVNSVVFHPLTNTLIIGADDGVYAYDLNDPANPTLRWHTPTGVPVTSVGICPNSYDMIYTAGFTATVAQILDGAVVSTTSLSASTRDIACGQNRAFLAHPGAIGVLDLSDPANPQYLGSDDPTPDQNFTDFRSVLVGTPTGSPAPLLFAADHREDIVVILDPATFPFTVVGSYAWYGIGPISLSLSGFFLFIGGLWELIRLNVSDPTNPAYAGSYYPGNVMSFISVQARNDSQAVYKATGEPGIREAVFSSSSTNIHIRRYEHQLNLLFYPFMAVSFFDDDDTTFKVTLTVTGVGPFGLLSPTPISVVAHDLSQYLNAVRYFIPTGMGPKQQNALAGFSLAIFDTDEYLLHLARTVDTTLQESATLAMSDYITDFQFLNDSTVVVAVMDTFRVLDIGTLNTPQEISTFVIPDLGSFVLLDTLLIAAARASGLQIWSLANPASPAFLGQYTGVNAEKVAAGILPLTGTPVAAVSSFLSSTVDIVDLTDPTAPSGVGSWSDFNVTINALDFARNFLFVGGRISGSSEGVLVALDLSNPASPTEASRTSVAGEVITVHAGDTGDVSVSTRTLGSYLFHFPEVAVAEDAPRFTGRLPFEVIPGGIRLLPTQGYLRFTVLDALGRRIVRVPLTATPRTIRLAPGVYFWRMEGTTWSGRFAILR